MGKSKEGAPARGGPLEWPGIHALDQRIEAAIEDALLAARGGPSPLGEAMAWALQGGGRLRPRLCLLAAVACGDQEPDLADRAAAGVELLHAASLVHDDLPIFDDADERRGRPTVHLRYGSAIALLTGDALIVLAFQVIAGAETADPARIAGVLRALARGAGTPHGIAAGQALELDPTASWQRIHRGKTAALFEAALAAGAIAGGGDPDAWLPLGGRIGSLYQLADDLADASEDGGAGRPNVVRDLGLERARRMLVAEQAQLMAAIPPVPMREAFAEAIRSRLERLVGRV